MKALITQAGTLLISGSNETETFALTQWYERDQAGRSGGISVEVSLPKEGAAGTRIVQFKPVKP